MVHAIFATGRNGEMGMADGSLPWRTCNNKIRSDLPENIKKQCSDDMAFFKKLTTGSVVIMGFNTYKTFPAPLPGRINIVIDRNAKPTKITASDFYGWIFLPSVETALQTCVESYPEKEIYIIGGAKLLNETYTKKLITGESYHTVIDYDFPSASVIFNYPGETK